jgi:hypothetical protein
MAQKHHKIKVYISKKGKPSWIVHSNHESRNVVYNQILTDTSMFSIDKLEQHPDSIHRYQNLHIVHNRVFFKSFYGGLILEKFQSGEYKIKMNYLMENKRDTLQKKNIVYNYKYLDYKENDDYYIVRLISTRPLKHTGHFKNKKLISEGKVRRSTNKLYNVNKK